MANENLDQEVDRQGVRRSGSQDQPDRSFGSQDQTEKTDKGSMPSGRQQQQGGATEADDELAKESGNRESTTSKPL